MNSHKLHEHWALNTQHYHSSDRLPVITKNLAAMADSAPPTESVAKLILDDVTGEEVSKTELKRRQKQREAERKKAEKAAAAPPKAEKKSTGVDESQLTPNVRSHRTMGLWKCSHVSSNTSRFAVDVSMPYDRASSQILTHTSSM